ncbi:MAG: ABC transporter permease [Beijerinckiaceae bacterium]
MLLETVRLAYQAILRNALRSFLTVLGIVIGVGAVIAMVTIGNGTTAKVKEDLSRLGTNLLFVRPGQFGPGRASSDAKPFNSRDIEALREQLRSVRAVSAVAQRSVTIVAAAANRIVPAIGTGNEYFVAQAWDLKRGRLFLDSELRGGRAVCIIGETVQERLFGKADPLGRTLRVQRVSCEIVGLLVAKGESGFGGDRDDVVIMPLRTFHRRIAGNTDISTIYVAAEDGADTGKVQRDIEYLLRERRGIVRGKKDDFTVRDMKQLAETQTAATRVLTGLLAAVAGVSLLVGGIGIMNIMLVSVTERTREIGIRLAIGALERQVLTQFLVEAVVLSLFGGLAGILLGVGLAWTAVRAMDIPFVPDLSIIAIAFAFSAAVGMIFGFFPARRAARLDPIEALRHE